MFFFLFQGICFGLRSLLSPSFVHAFLLRFFLLSFLFLHHANCLGRKLLVKHKLFHVLQSLSQERQIVLQTKRKLQRNLSFSYLLLIVGIFRRSSRSWDKLFSASFCIKDCFACEQLPHQLGNDEVIRKHVQRKIIEQLCAESLMLNLLIIDSGKYILELLLNTK